MPQSNNSGSFKNLDIDSLKEHALKWAEYYTEKIIDDSSKKDLDSIVMFQRIVLFKPSMDSGVDSKIKYVLIIELAKIKEEYKDLKWRQKKLPSLIDDHGILMLTNDAFFKEVYIEQPAGDPKNEWLIKCVQSGDMSYTSLVVSEPKEILYPKDEIFAGHSKKNSFTLFGDNWLVNYDGDEKTIKNTKRILYIEHLIDNPGVEIAAHDLVQLVNTEGTSVDQAHKDLNQKHRLEEEGLNLTELSIEDYTPEELGRFESIAYDSWGKLKNSPPDSSSAQVAEKEWESTKQYFFNEYSVKIIELENDLKFRRYNRLNPDAEKQRQLAQKQIKKAIEDFKKKIPSLYDHLNKLIDTGAKCIYHNDIENPIEWHIKR